MGTKTQTNRVMSIGRSEDHSQIMQQPQSPANFSNQKARISSGVNGLQKTLQSQNAENGSYEVTPKHLKESSQKSKKRKVEFSSKKEDFFGENNRDNFDLGL